MIIFFVSLPQYSSYLLLSESTYFIVRVLVSFVSCLGIPLFLLVYYYYFSGGVFFCCALIPGTLALDLPTLFSDVWFFSDCDHRIYTSLG